MAFLIELPCMLAFDTPTAFERIKIHLMEANNGPTFGLEYWISGVAGLGLCGDGHSSARRPNPCAARMDKSAGGARERTDQRQR